MCVCPTNFVVVAEGLFLFCNDSPIFWITQSLKFVNCNLVSSLHIGIGGLQNYLYICTINTDTLANIDINQLIYND